MAFELKPQGDDVLLTLTHRPVLEEFDTRTMMGWHAFLERLGTILRGEVPESREVLMEHNRVRYGVAEFKP